MGISQPTMPVNMAAKSRTLFTHGFLDVFYKTNLLSNNLNSISRCSQTYVAKSSAVRNVRGKKTSSQQWLRRQLKDPYVERARLEDYRCRSAYKLIEIDDRYKLLRPGDVVVDCGAAPGSWTQVAIDRVKGDGNVIGIDLQSMAPINGTFILDNSDFTTKECQDRILHHLSGRLADIVMSDMAPKASGIKALDHDNIVELCFATVKFSTVVLRQGGAVLCKLWQGAEQPRLEHVMKQLFSSVKVVKPDASRSESAEIYLLGRDFNGRRPPSVYRVD